MHGNANFTEKKLGFCLKFICIQMKSLISLFVSQKVYKVHDYAIKKG